MRRWHGKRAPNRILPASHPLPFALGSLPPDWRKWLPQLLLITGITLWIFRPVLQGEWILDDRWYLVDNPLMNGWTGLWKFWFQPGIWVEYYPIEETVLWVEWHLFGLHTFGYHLTNVFLHITGSLLIWRLFSKFGLRLAWVAGLIFAIHPVQVESVATISELKNTLSLPPFVLAMCAWIDYENRGRKEDYHKALGLFLVAMLCKITMSAFPVVILLYAWWRRGRIQWGDFKASAPFFVISLSLGALTVWAGHRYLALYHGQVEVVPMGGFFSRMAGSGLILSFYFSQCFLPLIISPFPTKWTVDPHRLIEFLPWVVFVVTLYGLWRKRRSWGKHVLLGLAFFVLNLLPFLGFIQVSYMSFTWATDHLLYIPILGLLGPVVAGLEDLDTRFPSARRVEWGIMTVLFLLMAWKSHSYAALLRSEKFILNDILKRDPENWIARDNLGSYFSEKKQYAQAVMELREAVRLKPDLDEVHYNLGLALDKNGQTDEAIGQYHDTLKLNSYFLKAYINLGEIMVRRGRFPEAEALFRQGLEHGPDDEVLTVDLGELLFQTGRLPEAIVWYQKAVDDNPDVAQLQYNLGIALLQTGDLPSAEEHLQTAVSLDPKIAAAHENLGVVLARLGHLAEAIEQFEVVLQIDPNQVKARDNLALALAQTGNLSAAVDQFQRVLQISPGDPMARGTLEKLQALRKNDR